MNKIAHKEYKENEMRNYRKFDFASLRNSRLQNGFWGHRTENYMEIINSMLEALLDEENSARLLNFEIGAAIFPCSQQRSSAAQFLPYYSTILPRGLKGTE